MAGGGGGSDTQTIKTEPWSAAQPYLRNILSTAGQLANTPIPAYLYQRTAPMNQMQQDALAAQANYGINVTAPLIAQYQAGARRMMQADRVANNPAVQSMMEANQRMVNRNLNENLLPQVGDQAIAAGQYGSSGHGVAQGIAMRGTQEALANANAQTLLDTYGKGLAAQSAALGQAPTTLGLGFIPSQTAAQVGAQQQAMDQALRDEAYQRFMYPYTEPWNRLNQVSNIMLPAAGLGGTTQQPNPNQSNPLISAIGGGSAGYALGSALPATMLGGMGGPIGLGVGLLGGLLG